MELIGIVGRMLLLQETIGVSSIFMDFLTLKELNAKLIEPTQVMLLELCLIKQTHTFTQSEATTRLS